MTFINADTKVISTMIAQHVSKLITLSWFLVIVQEVISIFIIPE